MSVKLAVDELRTISQLEALYSEWQELWNATAQSPFQSPMWLLPWARRFTGENLLVFAFRSGTRLVAVAPFYLWREGSNPKLLLLGNGNSDYLDICCMPEHRNEMIAQLASRLRSDSRFTQCEFNQLREESFLRDLSSLSTSDEPGDPCPLAQLVGKSDANYAPPRQLEKLRYYRRRAEKLAKLHFETATKANCRDLLIELFRLHRLRWSVRGGGGQIQDEVTQSFHLEAAERLAEAGHLRLHAAHLGDQIIGVLYALSNNQSTCYYLSGFDPQFEQLSPGALLIGHAIETALREAHTEFDFLRGQEPYKYSWGAIDRATFRRVITSSSVK